jgi:hypothetical protein
MLPSDCGMPATPMKESVLISASEAFTSAETRVWSDNFTLSVVPSRVFTAVNLLDLSTDAARLLGEGKEHSRIITLADVTRGETLCPTAAAKNTSFFEAFKRATLTPQPLRDQILLVGRRLWNRRTQQRSLRRFEMVPRSKISSQRFR